MTTGISNIEQGISNYEVKVVRNIAPYPLVPLETGAGIRVEKIGGNALDICPGLCHHIKCEIVISRF